MNREVLETQWVQVREFLRDKFSNLSEEDIRKINGRYDQLILTLQQRYGFTKEEAEEELRKWVLERGPKPAMMGQDKPFARPQRAEPESSRSREEGGSSFLKYLLLAAIPLLLLLGYFGYQNSKVPEQVTTPPTPTTSNQDIQFISVTPTDQNISALINRALRGNAMFAQDISTIRVTSQDGVVTLTGSVGSAQERDAISNIIKNINGVKQVNNRLEVK